MTDQGNRKRRRPPPELGARDTKLTWEEFSDLFDALNFPDDQARELLAYPAAIGSTTASYFEESGDEVGCETWEDLKVGFDQESTRSIKICAFKTDRPDFSFRYSARGPVPMARVEEVDGEPAQVDRLMGVFRAAFPLSPRRAFISWGKPLAQKVANVLEPMIQERIAPATAFTSMQLGPLENGLGVMLDELRQLIALTSKESVKSTMQFWEIAAAWGRGTTVVAILIDDVALDDLPKPLGQLQVVRLRNRVELDQFLKRAVLAVQPNTTYEKLTNDEYNALVVASLPD